MVRRFKPHLIILLWLFAISLTVGGAEATPPMSKDNLLDAAAKVQACSDAGYIKESDIQTVIWPRTAYYASVYLTEQEVEELKVLLEIRKKKAVTAFGFGCESAFRDLLALPKPPK